MQPKDFADSPCPIARSLDRVGEWWSMLILRDAFHGLRRFDEFQKSLGIAPNILTRRLNNLVETELLERRLYCEKPPRFEYVLTDRGREFWPVLIALLTWGNKHFAPEGPSFWLVDRITGEPIDAVLMDSTTHKTVSVENHKLATRPAASAALKLRIDRHNSID